MLGGLCTQRNRSTIHDDLRDVPAVDLDVSLCLADDTEALLGVGSQRGRVIFADVSEQLLVALAARGGERRCEEPGGNVLATAGGVDVGADDADVVEEMRIGGERLHALEAYE